ncbi:MAG TPA: hypothetical protein VNY52_06475, partial [Solirubrobacteraceae bacterium]|nr:hypothetical protein [Solirubrobacteraceae bacterium]
DANIATTAALVRGEPAPAWLAQLGLPARLVAHNGEVVHVGAWPAPASTRGRKPRAHHRRGEHPRADDPK